MMPDIEERQRIVHDMQRQAFADEHRIRMQAAKHEAIQAQIQLVQDLAVMQYSYALAACWALAFNPNLGKPE